MDRKISEVFEVPGIGKIKCVEAEDCKDCIFDGKICQKDKYIEYVGCCWTLFRIDMTPVKFIKIQ